MSTIKNLFANLHLGEKISFAIQSWAPLKTESIQPQHLEDIERLIRVLNLIKSQIDGIDVELYPPQVWNNMNTHIVNIQTHAVNFKNSKNVTYIQNANNELDAILMRSYSVNLKPSASLGKYFIQSEKEFTRELLKLLAEVKSDRDNWNSQLKAFNQALNELKTRLTQADQTIQSQKQRLDTSITEFQNQFSTAQESRRADYAAVIQNNSKALEGLIETYKTKFVKRNEELIKEHKTTLEQTSIASEGSLKCIKEIEEQVRRLFNVVGNVALTGDYKATAENESKVADKFRWISLGSMGLMVLIAGATFIHGLICPNVDWKLFAFRLAAGLIIALPALYAAQESAKHREREKMNRKIHLELSAIDAYLELLPNEKKHELKASLTEKFFGQRESQENEEPLTKHDLFNLFSSLIKAISKTK